VYQEANMRRLSLFALALAFGALACAQLPTEVQAQSRREHPRRHHAQAQPHRFSALNETIIRKRSFLDMGTVVPVGSENIYMADSTVYNHSALWSNTSWRRSDFGDEVLPGPFDLPGFLPAQPW
jgi:hypothetical protein